MTTLAEKLNPGKTALSQPTTLSEKLSQARSGLAQSQAFHDKIRTDYAVHFDGQPVQDSPSGGLVKGLLNAPARIGASLANTYTALTKGKQAADQQAAQGVNIPLLGNYKPIGQTGQGFGADLADTLGTGAEAASLVIPAGKSAELAGQTLRGTLLAAAKVGATQGAESGGLYGAGHEAQNPGASPESVVTQGALGAIGGGVAGGALSSLLGATAGRSIDESVNAIRKYYALKNATPQLGTSVERMQGTKAGMEGFGAARKKSLLNLYDEFAGQEQKHISDIKQDPAISLVGQRIGDEFNNVVKLRREAGQRMSDELEKTATKPINSAEGVARLQKELLDNGVVYDTVDKKIIPTDASKFSEADRTIMETYANELQKLGNKPTMKALDAFVSRIPKEVEGLKASRNIQFNTNAERIVGENLDVLRKALNKAGTDTYREARTKYSDLSQFLDEGISHLGKKTQSGDYARDASLAKSAVQSVLNNGKKDWLIKLEEHTGYPALDEATLALHAMKDAGDYKGSSLLELLTDGGFKSSESSPARTVSEKLYGLARAGGEYAKNKVAGSPAEQTRAYLKSIEDQAKRQK